MPQPVSDQDRKKLEAALAAAILLRYSSSHTAARKKLGQPDTAPSKDAQKRVSAFAADRSKKVQDGINEKVAAALAALPDDASEADKQQAAAESQQSIEDYNSSRLIPFLGLWAANQGTMDAAHDAPADDDPLCTWIQNTSYLDDCTAAANASPAPLQTLIDIAGGEPQETHDGCLCEIELA